LRESFLQEKSTMKTIIIHFFTGTGNTEHAATVLGDALRQQGALVTQARVTRAAVVPPQTADIHVFMFPVYGFTIPYSMLHYLKKIPNGKGAKAAVIANHGMLNMKGGVNTGYEADSALKATGILIKRGYDVFLTDRAGYPENVTIIAHAPSQENCREVVTAADKKINGIADKIISQKKSLHRYNIFDKLCGMALGWTYVYFGRWQIGKFYIADSRCNSCGTCVSLCPAGCIRMVYKKPRWNYKCDGCLRCYNFCPQNAIQVSILRAIMIVGLTIGLIPPAIDWYMPTYSVFMYEMPVNAWFAPALSGALSVIAVLFLYTAAFCGLLYVCDKVFFWLEQVPGVRKVFEWTYSRKLRRYRAPGY
jgi:Pyruvate/2-oxoacid:ferredoxin oxidoreductase delta subunit